MYPRSTRAAVVLARSTRFTRSRWLATVSDAKLEPNVSYKKVTHPDTTAPTSTHSLINSHTSYLLNTYVRAPLLFTHGSGSTLYSTSPSTTDPTQPQSYLDFTAGIAVNALGHADPQIAEIMKDQGGKLVHSSNVVWNEWAGELAKGLVENTKKFGGLGLSPDSGSASTSTDGKKQHKQGAKVFFSNSGTEANEGALKFARMHGKSLCKGSHCSASSTSSSSTPTPCCNGTSTTPSPCKSTIICFSQAFHGRSLGALSVTPNPKYQSPFAPLIPNVRVGELNRYEGLDELIDESCCGVIVEPIQGEGGVNEAEVEWLRKVAKRAREVGAVLIYDEIQCGLFRTGNMWAHSKYPIDAQPDIVTMAKPLANGFPIGAILVKDEVADIVTVGSHGTTFGGQVMATRIGAHVLSRLSDFEFQETMNATATHLSTLLDRLPSLFPSIISGPIRGRGLIRGIPFSHPNAPGELVKRARQRGVLLLTAGSDAVRIVPSLNVTVEECDHASAVIESSLFTMAEDGWGQQAETSKAAASSASSPIEAAKVHALKVTSTFGSREKSSPSVPNGARAMHSSARRDMASEIKKGTLNRHSRMVTQSKSQGASQAMLYATDGVEEEADFQKPMVGVASVWYEGNPCNKHLLGLGQRIKKSLVKEGIIGYQFGTVGVSDGISMGTFGMSYSLQSRDLIADQVETAAGGHWLDGMVVVPGCDKNMPGTLMALGRLNRPGLMVYGGTIKPGQCGGEKLDIVSAFQSYGQYLQEGQTEEAEKKRANIIRNACPGAGACGGMYTANTMASAAEAMGMTLPGSSSSPAEYPEKLAECDSIGAVMLNLLELNLKPRDIMTREAFENALVLTMVLGGSTNAVLHMLAIAHSCGIELTIDDFQSVSDRIPFLADLKPSGKYVMEDVNTIGGTPSVMAYLIKEGLMTGETKTVTGKTLGENVDRWMVKHGKLWEGQQIIRPLNNPIKSTGHIRILKGNLAPLGSVAKITGKEGLVFHGKCRAFDREEDFVKAVESGSIKKGEKTVVVLRYLGPKGGPGMPEMLKPTSLIMGAGLGYDVACLTDGRFSGGSHGFVIGHVTPEAQEGGPIALVQDGDMIHIDAEKNTLSVDVSEEEMKKRREAWKAPPLKVSQGALYKYIKVVANASQGCVTDA